MAKPEIRLKGFEGEWQDTLLKDICDINPSSNIPDVFEYVDLESVVGTSIVSHRTERRESAPSRAQRLAKSGDIFYQTVRPYQKNNCIYYEQGKPYVFSTGYAQIRSQICPEYIFNILQTDTFVNEVLLNSTGTSYPAINPTSLSNLRISYSKNCDEQQSIAEYFKSLDSMIQTTTKKILSLKQLKSASLISMFPQNGESKPRVRFKGFEGDWKKAKLSSIAKRITRKNTQLESTLPLTISAAEGLVEQTMFFNNVVASSNVSGYYLLKKGEFAYNKSYSNGYPFGAVKRLDRYDMGVLSTLYIVFSVDESVCSDYIVHFFDTSLWHKEVAMRAAEGARNHGLLNIGAEDFLDIDIILPKSKDEQQRIASFFASLDKQISLQEQRLEKLKQIKSACLDKMFV